MPSRNLTSLPSLPPTPSSARLPLLAGLAVALTLGAGVGVVAATSPRALPATVTVPVTTTVTASASPAPTVTVPAPPPTSGRAAPAGPVSRFGDGTYLVGTDVEAGSYRSAGPAPGGNGHCYWARLRASGESKIVADELTTGAARFTARKGEYVQVAGCEFTRS